ncbi:hypothetical protein A2837_02175 [Candidatus Kaiserbacteria bacterium RIFCSPHIGHO2_01_FULL_46_22]|uniref:Uncharacterized protein n=1 Tax=Candidatus Kaiserbacteria bacterium RIFCSPHIGHO2_01_FULL_46_22 TaxID=1798475 RepID=A0A1F6BYK6_9BACT|nr:MAG: hypothetical protein A2837_02175 [Candidatus Kaiserbacteria bacterium RIFCSPHIGHO2_01_FULL_46_22]
MKVLVQDWKTPEGRLRTSISKDQEQLDETVKRLAPRLDSEGEVQNWDKAVTPEEGSWEIEIPEDSIFVEMVGFRTVFLEPDEMDVLYSALENRSNA